MAKHHPELNLEVEEQQAAILETKNYVKFDPKNECARGCVKIFNLRSQADRRIFLDMVSWKWGSSCEIHGPISLKPYYLN